MLFDCCWEYKERGKELKVPHHASATAAHDGNLPNCDSNLPNCDSNMPYIKATCLIQLPLAFIPNNYITPKTVKQLGILYRQKEYLYLLVTMLKELVLYKDNIINFKTGLI